jgi:hypothetical protein
MPAWRMLRVSVPVTAATHQQATSAAGITGRTNRNIQRNKTQLETAEESA